MVLGQDSAVKKRTSSKKLSNFSIAPVYFKQMKPYVLEADVQRDSVEFLRDCEQLILILYWNIKDDFDHFIIGVHLLHFTKDPQGLEKKTAELQNRYLHSFTGEFV